MDTNDKTWVHTDCGQHVTEDQDGGWYHVNNVNACTSLNDATTGINIIPLVATWLLRTAPEVPTADVTSGSLNQAPSTAQPAKEATTMTATTAPTVHALAGKTIATLTEREMVARNGYKDVVTYTETTLTFTDGTTHVYGTTHEDLYSPVEYDPNAPECGCGATMYQSSTPGKWVCNECGEFSPDGE